MRGLNVHLITGADTFCTAARKRVKTVNEVLAPVRQLSVALGGASASAPKYGLLVCSPQTANLTCVAARQTSGGFAPHGQVQRGGQVASELCPVCSAPLTRNGALQVVDMPAQSVIETIERAFYVAASSILAGA